MRRRISFKRLRHLGEGLARRYPKATVGMMFATMCCTVVWLLTSDPSSAGSGVNAAIDSLYAKATPPETQRPLTADILTLLHLYASVSAIDPDSLTARDSTLLKGIDEQLNSIIYENDRL